jgi:hypothetical protein
LVFLNSANDDEVLILTLSVDGYIFRILFAIIVASIVVLTSYNPITYGVTDNGIIACKGIYRVCSYDNIKNIKLKKSMFNKNKGSIKFKLYKGSSINYNFDNIENPEEVYKIIEEQMNK